MNEQKNLLLAIVASLIILLIFQYLFPTERKMIEENVKSENQIKNVPQEKILEKAKWIFDQGSKKLDDKEDKRRRGQRRGYTTLHNCLAAPREAVHRPGG